MDASNSWTRPSIVSKSTYGEVLWALSDPVDGRIASLQIVIAERSTEDRKTLRAGQGQFEDAKFRDSATLSRQGSRAAKPFQNFELKLRLDATEVGQDI